MPHAGRYLPRAGLHDGVISHPPGTAADKTLSAASSHVALSAKEIITMAYFRDISNDKASPQWTPAESERPARDVRPVNERGFMWLREVLRRRRSRVVLSGLDDYLLKDIGMTRAEAEFEANKAFWLP
jgi:uncharacterized protein YjiS (DUF1127 family)